MFTQRRSLSASKADASAAASARALPGCLDDEEQQVEVALARWSGRHALEASGAALLKLLKSSAPSRNVPAPPTESPEVAFAKQALKRSGRKAPKGSDGLRADAPSFTPGQAFQFQPTLRLPEEKTATKSLDASPAKASDASLPAVISVKKSSRGCAVVLLRDPAVVERGVKQSVAVIDGVCVEVRRHTPKYDEAVSPGQEEEMGVFIAWGHRVERQVTITVDGIEAYFNALAESTIAEGVEVKPPFEELCLSFHLRSSGALLPLAGKPCVDRPDKERLLAGGFCGRELVEGLWAQKKRLDDLWNIPPPPLARSLTTRVARAQLFPHSGEGGKEHENRAGDKLAELSAAVGLLEGVPKGSAFLDLCGGPGAWSQHLLAHPALALRGFGFTLRTEAGDAKDWKAEEKDQWYPDLLSDPRWKALWGADGTGDLLKPGNVQHCAKQLAKEGSCFLCVADGGFSDKKIPPNHLELYFYRLMLGELLMAISCLQQGGRFVCKLYTTFSGATSALLYLTTRLFESSEIVKPKSSRVTGPERYLAAFGFQGNACKEVATVRSALLRAHELCAGSSILTTPLLTPIVEVSSLERDAAFMESARAMAEGLCDRQAKALCAVVDRAGELEAMAMALARKAGAAEPASKEKVEKDRADYEKHKQRKLEARGDSKESGSPSTSSQSTEAPWSRRGSESSASNGNWKRGEARSQKGRNWRSQAAAQEPLGRKDRHNDRRGGDGAQDRRRQDGAGRRRYATTNRASADH